MSKRKCVVCGKDPAEGFASIYRDGTEQWYCHPDDGESCYVNESHAEDFRESERFVESATEKVVQP